MTTPRHPDSGRFVAVGEGTDQPLPPASAGDPNTEAARLAFAAANDAEVAAAAAARPPVHAPEPPEVPKFGYAPGAAPQTGGG